MCANRTFSKKYNEYFETSFLVEVFDKYLQYCEKHCFSPQYLAYEFEQLLCHEIPDGFVTQLLYHAKLEGMDSKVHIVDVP
ncbi:MULTISPECIES: hypothetical protein [unclassified Colwellia]|uniref:hypothetical protein n=1 Tax=unclassified Colwellia TaxID=196834 RepID=UPI0015F70FE7|nr:MULTISPECIES: hypothetical protein [unclassified Colwellia]MBA6356624.1 hypothetical protein [Colwellia sp. BRX8-3]MBA6361184.1 hypothetical protein [Colwellia sp. BRX8-6]MBA6368402.1 hypothetical protein [Colwellia sp. BRX8-5]MBA6377340.1 hypothetical protein [Colwellia sp. BRX8-2]